MSTGVTWSAMGRSSAATVSEFSTSFDTGAPSPTWRDSIDSSGHPAGAIHAVGGFCCGIGGPETSTRTELAHSGNTALLYSGNDLGSNGSFAYTKVFDLSANPVAITGGTVLSYWIYPQAAPSVPVSGRNSACVAVDLIFADGTSLRDSGTVDQRNVPVHPARQCASLKSETWNLVSANIGTRKSGTRVVRIDVGYDQPANTGGYRGYIDDIRIASSSTTSTSAATSTAAGQSGLSGAPSTAAGFTKMFADKNDQTWSGSDGMTSIKGPTGAVYWLTGDTMLSNGVDADGSYPDSGTTMIANRILLQRGDKLVNAVVNRAGGVPAVPDPSTHTSQNQERYWAQGAFFSGRTMYVLSQRVVNENNYFKTIGTELAKYTVATDGRLTYVGMVRTPSTGVSAGVGPTLVQWAGDALVKDGYAYIYGYTLTSNQYVGHYSYVARVPLSQVETPSAWRYYKKSTGTWVTSMTQMDQNTDTQPDAIVASQVSSVRVIAGKVVIAHKPWNGWGSTVKAEIGTTPVGPFTSKNLFESPAGVWEGKSYMTYGPMLHPEQTLSGVDSGKILVSIDWNGTDFWKDTMAHADLYKPRFHAVSLP